MILGLDFYDTITARPQVYAQLAQAIRDAGGKVIIISAVHAKNVSKLKQRIAASGVPHDDVEVLTFNSYPEVPALKLVACQKHSVDLMIDDRADTCNVLIRAGLFGIQSPPSLRDGAKR